MPKIVYYDLYDGDQMILENVRMGIIKEHLPDYDRCVNKDSLYLGRYRVVHHGKKPGAKPDAKKIIGKYTKVEAEKFAMHWILACYRLQVGAGKN